MTTASPSHRTSAPSHRTTTVGSVIRAASLVTFGAGAAAVLLAALLAGSSAALGAGIGALLVCVLFATGTLVLNVVAGIAPAASLLVAMLTYTLKVVLIGLVFLALSRSGALEDAVDARWLGGTVIACTLVWSTSQIVATMRARIPVYDEPRSGREADAR